MWFTLVFFVCSFTEVYSVRNHGSRKRVLQDFVFVQVQRQAEVEAEQDTRELTKPVPTSEYLLLRQAYVKAYGTLEEKVLPSKEYLERKLLEVEHGEFQPESLQEVTTRDELDPDTLIPVWD